MADATIIPQSTEGDQAVVDQKVQEANTVLPDTLKFNIMQGATVNPDQFAQERKIAQQTGVPVEAVPSNYEILKQRAAVEGYNLDTLRQTDPVTAQFLDDQIHAKLAHDDINSLQNLEKRFGAFKQDRGPTPTVSSIASGLFQGLISGAKKQAAGAQMQLADLLGTPDTTGFIAQRKYTAAQGEIDRTTPQFESSTAEAVYQGVASTLQNLPGIALSVATGTEIPGLAAIGLQTQTDAYGKYRARGATPQQAITGSGIEGAVEVGTEMLPMKFLVDKLGKVGFKEFATGLLGREIPGEEIATLLQDATDTAIANPDKTWAQYLAERPAAFYQTGIATLTQALLMGGAHKVMSHHEAKAEAATTADNVQQVMDAAKEAKLHQRDPQTFGDFVEGLSEANKQQNAYISPEALNQIIATHGKDASEVLDQMPSVDKAMANATETGQDIAIPLSEFITYGAGSPIEADLVQHIRLDPAKPSLAELSAESDSVAEAERFVNEGAGKDDALNEQSHQLEVATVAIQSSVAEQLQAAGYEQSTAKDTALSIGRAIAVLAQRANPNDIVGESQRIWQQYNLQIQQVMQGVQGNGELVGKAQDAPQEIRSSMVPDSALSGDIRTGLQNIFLSDYHDGSPVDLASKGFTPEEIKALESEGLATDGRMDSTQFGAYMNEADDRLNKRSQFGDALNQKDYGQLDINDSNNFVMNLFSGRNLSTVLHEAGHFYLEVIADLAVREQSGQQVKDDFKAIADTFGFDPEAWHSMTLDQKRDAHERFARSNEAYLLRGVAPSERLRMVFYRFKEWLKQVYQTVRRGITGEQALNVKMSPEVIEIFDRIYATDLEIANMREQLELKPSFIDTPNTRLEMSPEDIAAYQKIAAKEIEQQESKLRHDIMESEVRARKQWYRDEVKIEAGRIRKEQEASKPFATFNALVATEGIKLSREQLVEKYGEEVVKALPKGKQAVYATDGTGWDLESAAATLQYDNADQMIEDLQLVKGQRKDAYVNQEAEKRTRDKYGDPMVDGTIVDRAVDAIHSEYRTERIQLEINLIRKAERNSAPAVKLAEERARKAQAYQQRWMEAEKNLAVERERGISRERQNELKAQIKQLKEAAREAKRQALESTRIRPVQEIREQAIRYVEDLPFDQIKPNIYLLAERKASRAAAKALAKGEYAEAKAQKEKELLNNYLYVEAMKAKKEAAKKFKDLDRYNKAAARERIAKSSRSGADYLGQIDNLLISWGLREPTEGEVLANKTLAQFYAEQQAAGREPAVDLEILDITNPRTPESMDIAELRALHDAITSIAKLASRHNAMLNESIKETKAQVIDAIRTRIEATFKNRERPRDLDTLTASQKVGDWANALDAKNLPLRAIIELIDNGTTGPAHDFILNPLYEADNHNAIFRGELAEKLDAALEQAFGKDAKRLEDTFLTPLDSKPITRKTLISMVFNLGTETGLQRVMLSEKLTEDQLMEAASNLTEQDAAYIQEVWNILETLWPQMAEFQRSMGGVTPEKLPDRPFALTLKNGKTINMQGKYYPLKTDTSKDSRAALEEAKSLAAMQSGAYIRFSTSQSAFKKRVRNARPILYNFEYVLSRHLTEIVKDITHRAVQIDTSAILSSPAMRKAFDERLSSAHREAAMQALDAVIMDGLTDPAIRLSVELDGLATRLRGNISAGAIAYKAGTMLIQPANITNVTNRIGAGWYLRGINETFGGINPFGQFMDAINESVTESPFMARRIQNMDRDVADSFREYRRSRTGSAYETFRMIGLSMPGYSERLISIAAWKGAKARGYSEGLRGNALMHYADDAVRASFGSGETIDQTAVTRRQGAVRLMTMFMTPIVAVYSENSAALRHALNDPKRTPALILTVLLTTILPGLLIAMIKRHGPNECESGDAACYAKWAAATSSASLLDTHYVTRITSDTLSAIIQGQAPRDPNFSPAVGISNQIIRSHYKIGKDIFNGNDVSADDLISAFAADATLLGVPGAQQLGVSGKFLADAYAGNKSFSDDPAGIILTKPKTK